MSGRGFARQWAILVCLGCSLAAYPADPLGTPFYFSWSAVPGAGGYVVEVSGAAGEPVLSEREKSSTHDKTLRLPPGRYRLRMVTLNRFLRAEASSPWINFRVDATRAPIFISLDPASLSTGSPGSLRLTADSLAPDATARVLSPGGRQIEAEVRRLSKRELLIKLPALSEAGVYELVITNPPGLAVEVQGALTVSPPIAKVATLPIPTATPQPLPNYEPAPVPTPALASPSPSGAHRKLLVSLGWSYGMAVADWGDIYVGTPRAAFLRADYFLTPFERPRSGSTLDAALGLDARYFSFAEGSDPSIVSSSLTSLAVAIDPSVTWSAPFLSVRARAGGGLAYSNLSAASPTGGPSTRTDSLDLFLMGELGLEIPLAARVRLGLSAGYERFFYTRGMDLLEASTYAAFDF